MEMTFDLSNRDVLIEKVKISVDTSGEIVPSLYGGFTALDKPDKFKRRFQFKRKFTALSADASIVIDVTAGNSFSMRSFR